MILKRVDIKENKGGKDVQSRGLFHFNFIIISLFVLLPLVSFSQTREELEKQRLQLQKEIKEIMK